MTDSKPTSTTKKTKTKKKIASKSTASKAAIATDKVSKKKTSAAKELNNTDSPAKIDASQPVTEPTSTTPAQNPMTDQVKKQSNTTAIFALIFSLAALAGVALTWYQEQVVSVRSESGLAVGITEIGGQVSRISDSVSRLQKQQAKIVSEGQLNARLQETKKNVDKKLGLVDNKISRLSGAQAQLTKSVNVINNDLKSGNNAYVVDEVAQLLKLANNSLVFSDDVDSAMNALSVAASQLKSITDPRYSSVRIAVAKEIALLKNIPKVDKEGMSASLSAISDNIPSLPLENEPQTKAVSFNDEVVETENSWRAELAELWAEMKSAIQIQKIENAPKPLLAPDQRYFLDQNLQLLLTKADLALLQERDAIFQQSIDAASKWLLDYFDINDPEVANVLAQLSDIRDQKISVKLPKITGSFEALQAIKDGQ